MYISARSMVVGPDFRYIATLVGMCGDRDVANDGTVSCGTSPPSLSPTSKASILLRNCSVQKSQQRYLLDMSMVGWQYRPGTGAWACRPRTLYIA